jgi:hypothetical protein
MHLSPELEEVKEQFLANLTNGGLPAVRQMVEDLATEAEGASALGEAGRHIADEAIEYQETLDDSQVVEARQLGHETTLDDIHGKTRHSFAVWLLSIVDPQEKQ